MTASMITCTRRLHFCSGHRVPKHESKCRHPHGHNYVVLLTARAPKLDEAGRVIDFGVLKERFGEWIDYNWDHGWIWQSGDSAVRGMLEAFEAETGFSSKNYVMSDPPTAECLAQHLLDRGPYLLKGTNVELVRVKLWETENCYVVAELEGWDRS